MTEFTSIVRNALEYHDANKKKYYNFVRKIKNIQIDTEAGIAKLYNKKNENILTSRIGVIGKHLLDTNIWVWGWAIGSLSKNMIGLSKKVLIYGLDLDEKFTTLKYELVTSRYKIMHPIQVDIHVAITSYLSHQPCVIQLYYGEGIHVSPKSKTKEDVDDLVLPEKKNGMVYYMSLLDYENIPN